MRQHRAYLNYALMTNREKSYIARKALEIGTRRFNAMKVAHGLEPVKSIVGTAWWYGHRNECIDEAYDHWNRLMTKEEKKYYAKKSNIGS